MVVYVNENVITGVLVELVLISLGCVSLRAPMN